MIRPGTGYKVKNVSGQTSLIIDPPRKPAPLQFECTVLTEKVAGVTKRWMKVEPGFVKILNYNVLMIVSSGNRDVMVGDNSIISGEGGGVGGNTLGVTKLYKVEGCNCYKALRYNAKAATLALNQFQLEDEEDSIVVLYRAAPGYGKPRLAVISASQFASCFRYGNTGASVGEGSVPTIKHLFQTGTTTATCSVTVPGEPPVTASGNTGPIPTFGKFSSLWDRLGLSVKLIALYDSTTKKLTQYHTGDVDLTETAESYIKPASSLVTTGPCIDDGWASSFYITGGTGAPSGYTFNYSV